MQQYTTPHTHSKESEFSQGSARFLGQSDIEVRSSSGVASVGSSLQTFFLPLFIFSIPSSISLFFDLEIGGSNQGRGKW